MIDRLRARPWLVVLLVLAALWTVWIVQTLIFDLGGSIPTEGRVPEGKP